MSNIKIRVVFDAPQNNSNYLVSINKIYLNCMPSPWVSSLADLFNDSNKKTFVDALIANFPYLKSIICVSIF